MHSPEKRRAILKLLDLAIAGQVAQNKGDKAEELVIAKQAIEVLEGILEMEPDEQGHDILVGFQGKVAELEAANNGS